MTANESQTTQNAKGASGTGGMLPRPINVTEGCHFSDTKSKLANPLQCPVGWLKEAKMSHGPALKPITQITSLRETPEEIRITEMGIAGVRRRNMDQPSTSGGLMIAEATCSDKFGYLVKRKAHRE
jgi:hypothetical protein